MREEPLVTVYIPTYNRRALLERAVASVLEQDYRNIELIVVDDGSSDGTRDFLEQIKSKDSRLKYLNKKGQRGAPASRNQAILNSNGYFITGLDDDDFFKKDRVSSFVAAWKNDDIALFTDTISISRKGERYKQRKDFVAFKDLLQYNHIGNQVFTTKERFIQSLFDERLSMWQDLDCWLNMLKSGGHIRCLHKANYCFDTSHDHERISQKNFFQAKRAWSYVSEKYSLNKEEKIILKNHCYHYKPDRLELGYFVDSTLSNTPFSFKKILPRLMLSHLKSRYR
ncbi:MULTISPECIES: glycosyltransferase [Halomonadaceae]|uniref:glycosyltransferase n=1 Tax=Halomonadaceae TaxID=28256 RepID=UPI00159998D6|nr:MULTISPECIES: glycosyltransferase [Halomonas]QJQ94007.1 glycosyltransferase [Halomonas sp. PA5]